MRSLEIIMKILNSNHNIESRRKALEYLKYYPNIPDGKDIIMNHPTLLVRLIEMLKDTDEEIAMTAGLILIDFVAIEEVANKLVDDDFLLQSPKNIVHQCLDEIYNNSSKIADQCCMILSNLTRMPNRVCKVLELFETSGKSFNELIEIFTKKKYNENATLYHLGSILCNLTQSSDIRHRILDKKTFNIRKLLAFTEYPDSMIKRAGAIGAIKNCCFDTDYHEYLLLTRINILPKILLPLAGPEEFDDDDNEKLPIELQYLPETKERETDPEIRFMLLETLLQLCSKKTSREFIRSKNAYIILRELHKWETDQKAKQLCEELAILLQLTTEDEIGIDNLKDLHISDDVLGQLESSDKNSLIN